MENILNYELSRYSNKKIIVNCDTCKMEYEMSYRRATDNYIRNNNLIICQSCKISTTKKHIKYNYDRNMFENIISDEHAYLLGWIASDGSIDGNKMQLVIKDLDILKKLASIVCSEFPIWKKDDCFGFRICSKTVCNNICKWLKVSQGKKFDKIQFPDIAAELKYSFLRGLFDGDGHVVGTYSPTPVCSISSGSKLIKEQIEDFVGIKCNINAQNIVWNGKNAIKFLDLIYNNDYLALERKKNTYLYWKNNWIPKKDK